MCKKDLPLNSENFSWKDKSKGIFQWHCKPCHKEYRKQHYEANRQRYIDRAQNWELKQKIQFIEWMKDKTCVDCGIADLRVLEFDHLRDKSFTISQKIGVLSFDRLLEEIEKCDIVCANCHKIRTSTTQNWYSYHADMA